MKDEDTQQLTVSDLAFKLNTRLTDGFFYRTILPILLKNDLLVETGERKVVLGAGRYSKIYRVNKKQVSIFLLANFPIVKPLFKWWVAEGHIES